MRLQQHPGVGAAARRSVHRGHAAAVVVKCSSTSSSSRSSSSSKAQAAAALDRAKQQRADGEAVVTAALVGRRAVLAAAAAAAALVPPPPAARADAAAPAGGAQPRTYTDNGDAFSITVPPGWLEAEGAIDGNASFTGSSGARRTLVWYPSDAPAADVNVTLVITNTSAEFTKLGSFGSATAFGERLVNSMDRGFLLRRMNGVVAPGDEPVQLARLVDAEEQNDMYKVEYTVKKVSSDGELSRHLYSVVALAPGARYNRLYTLTAQTLEERAADWAPVLRRVLDSFVPPAPAARGAPAA